MEDYSYINIISNSENIRLYILEHSLHLEEMISVSLGSILNIDWKDSKSFGYSSTALSFNQKVRIIQDIKGLNKIEIQKLTDLMVIRNKFAHVKSVETFQDFFDIGGSGKEVKKNLDKWYSTKFPLFKSESEEFKYKFYFCHLFLDITLMLVSKITEHAFEEGKKAGNLNYLNALKDEIIKLPGASEIMSKAIERVKKDIKSNQIGIGDTSKV